MDGLVEKRLLEPAHSPEPELDSANYQQIKTAAPITVIAAERPMKTIKESYLARGTYVSSTAPTISNGSSASRAVSGATARVTAHVSL